MIKPLQADAPYPSTNDISPDAFSLKIISPAYASARSELGTVLQYIYHSYFFEKCGYEKIYNTVMSISVCEMIHLRLLGKTVLSLGAAPVYTQYPPDFFNFYSSKYVNYSRNIKTMLEDDIIGEKQAISGYEKMLCKLKNKSVSAVIARIIQDEKIHLSALENLRGELNG